MNDILNLGGGTPTIGKSDPRNYETIRCSKCNGIVFDSKYILKRVSGVELGAGAKPMMIPLNVLVCSKCGAILDDDIKGYKLENDLNLTENEEKKESSLLI